MIQNINSEIINKFWCTKQLRRGVRLLSLEKICSPRLCRGLNILNLLLHMLARKATLLPKFAGKTLLSDMFDHLKTKSFDSWHTNHWDVVFRKLDRHIKGCPFSSNLLKHWKEVLHHTKWRGRNLESENFLCLESLDWSVILPRSVAEQEPRKAYFLAKKGLKSITDVVNDQGHLLGFNGMTCLDGYNHIIALSGIKSKSWYFP